MVKEMIGEGSEVGLAPHSLRVNDPQTGCFEFDRAAALEIASSFAHALRQRPYESIAGNRVSKGRRTV